MKVFTLTSNLLAETTCSYAAWQEGHTHRATGEFFQVGGKGINVSHMLHRFGDVTEALCFPGGFSGLRCEQWMTKRGIPFRAFRTALETRAGWVVRAPGRGETTFLGPDSVVDEAAVAACCSFLEEQPDGTVLAINGSVPGWTSAAWNPLHRLLESWTPRRTLVVDTYGEILPCLARLPCAMVKINRREFSGLARVPVEDVSDARMPELLTRVCANFAARRLIITDGGGIVWFTERGGAVESIAPPRIEEVSPTGSGDVLLAGLIHASLLRGLDLRASLEFALPIAAANAASPGVADFDLAPFGFAG